MLNKTLASLSLAFATSLVACKDPQIIAVPAPVTDVARPGQMTVTGSATLDVSPDCADMTITLIADGVKPGQASAAVQAKEQELIAALMKLGIETPDLKLSQVTLVPIYVQSKDGWTSQTKVATYRAEITITATTKHFDQIGAIMDAGAQAGASELSSQFRRSDLAELKKKVREMALTAAKDKASQTAKVLGIEVGRVVAVNENAGGYMWSNAYFPQAARDADTARTMAVSIGGSLQPLTLDVTVGFELSKTT